MSLIRSVLLLVLRYQDYQDAEIPVVEDGGVKVRVMAGQSMGTDGPIAMRNPGMLLDVQLSGGAIFTQEVRRRRGRGLTVYMRVENVHLKDLFIIYIYQPIAVGLGPVL